MGKEYEKRRMEWRDRFLKGYLSFRGLEISDKECGELSNLLYFSKEHKNKKDIKIKEEKNEKLQKV